MGTSESWLRILLCVLIWFGVQDKIRSSLINMIYTLILFKNTISERSIGAIKRGQLSVSHQKNSLTKQSYLIDLSVS